MNYITDAETKWRFAAVLKLLKRLPSAVAGIKKYLKKSKPNEVIVSVFTGHGLKTTEKILKIFGK